MRQTALIAVTLITIAVFIWAYSHMPFTTQKGQAPKTIITENQQQASLTHTSPSSDLIFTVAMLGKSRKEIMANHGDAFKIIADQHFKDQNYIVYSWYNLMSYAYYFTNDSSEICYRYALLAFNMTKSTFNLTYPNTHFRIEGSHWIDENDIFKDQEDRDPCHTRWEITEEVDESTGTHAVKLTATAFKYRGRKALEESIEKVFKGGDKAIQTSK